MTREELKAYCLDQIEMCKTWAVGKGEEPSGKIYEEHKLILELLEQEPRWILVSERLPEESGDYLVTICYDLFGKGTIREIRRDIFYTSSKRWLYEGDDVIAWMPLPKPYELQKSEET